MTEKTQPIQAGSYGEGVKTFATPTTIAATGKAPDAENVREVLEAAWNTIHGDQKAPWERLAFGVGRSRFRRFLDAEAYTDAALMLVPNDGSVNMLDLEFSYEPSEPEVWSACTIRWYPPHKSGGDWHARIESGPIPALAIARAALSAATGEA
jgi:hypothetical protein